MPVKKCTTKGKSGHRWGSKGKCYPGKSGKPKATRQGRAAYASGYRGSSKKKGVAAAAAGPKFVGEEGGRIIFYSAPKALHERIESVIAQLEEQSKDVATVRVIHLEHADAERVADAIESAFGRRRGGAGGKKRGRTQSGASGAGFNIVANSATKSLFVFADDAMYEKIESLVRSIDQPLDIGFEVKIFPLQYAEARTVHTMMITLVTDFMRRAGPGAKDMEAFAVEADDTANALVVLGSPVVFGFVEDDIRMCQAYA